MLLEFPHPLAGHAQLARNVLQSDALLAVEAEAMCDDHTFARVEPGEQSSDGPTISGGVGQIQRARKVRIAQKLVQRLRAARIGGLIQRERHLLQGPELVHPLRP